MATRKLQLLTLSLCLLLLAPAAWADPDSGSAVPVEVTVYLLDVSEVNNAGQAYQASYFLEYRWTDPELAHTGPRPVSMGLNEVWNPRIQVLNQRSVSRSFPEAVEVYPIGEVVYRQRMFGTFSQQYDLRTFPFDSQKLSLQLVPVGHGMEGVQLIGSDGSGLSGNYSLTDWEIGEWSLEAGTLPLGPGNSPIPAMTFSVDIERNYGYYVVKVLLPLILIVSMAMMAFWISPELATSQIGVATTSMLTLIAYRFAVGASLPKLSFLTRLDYFMLASTLLVFSVLLIVVWTSALARNGMVEKAEAIDMKARWLMPLIFVVLAFETLYLNLFLR